MTTPHNPDCIFCKLIDGIIPSHKIYEDENTIAFLDVGPITNGHTLLIPKAHYQTIDQLPQDLAANSLKLIPKIAKALKLATDSPGLNILQNNHTIAGQVVKHVHFHLIPRTQDDNFKFTWPSQDLPTPQALQLLKEIKENLED